MIVKCYKCNTNLRISDIIPGEKKAVKCPKCGHVSVITKDSGKPLMDKKKEIKETEDFNVEKAFQEGTTLIAKKEGMGELRVPVGKKLYLEILEGNEKGKSFEFQKGKIMVGRKGTDFVIDDPNVSRKHFVIEAWGRDQYYIRDLASTNGTFLNGTRIVSTKLKDGDIIDMGSTKLKFIVKEGG